MEYCNIFIAEYQYNQYNNNIIVPSADLNNPGRRPTVYHIHTQQGQQNREKANSIGRRPIV